MCATILGNVGVGRELHTSYVVSYPPLIQAMNLLFLVSRLWIVFILSNMMKSVGYNLERIVLTWATQMT
jgi:hypothetical protein